MADKLARAIADRDGRLVFEWSTLTLGEYLERLGIAVHCARVRVNFGCARLKSREFFVVNRGLND